MLVALHAKKTARFVATYHKKFPTRPIVVVLTGTDVYGSSLGDAATSALEAAGAIVALQPLAIQRLSKRLRKKAIAVLQSAPRVEVKRRTSAAGPVRFCVIGHLRHEKDPLRTAYALRYLNSENLEVLQAGRILDSRYAARVKVIESRDARYRYLGEVSRARALRILSGCDALVLSSRSEGGANVASEAIANGIPVLASRIDGNAGVLGARYAGYYPVGSSKALAALIDRFMHDREFARTLRRQIRALEPSVRFESERSGLARAIRLARRMTAVALRESLGYDEFPPHASQSRRCGVSRTHRPRHGRDDGTAST